jgi:hypothetical protein
MKKLLTIAASLLLFSEMNAQTSVPTSWDCTGATPPNGWTFVPTGGNGNTNYTASAACDGVSSLRLDAQNEALIIFLGQQPGEISYQIGGSTSGSPFEGTFSVQESVDGVTYTNIISYVDSDLGVNACLSDQVMPANPLSRYIRFFFENKVSGSNVKLDEISIAVPAVEEASIEVQQAGATILNGGVCAPFNSASVTFAVNNLGSIEPLEVSAINFDGPNASAFSVASPTLPFTVNPGESINLVVNFLPSNAGTNVAEITLESNDADDAQFSFTLYGVNGTLATEPVSDVSNFETVINKSYRTVLELTGSVLEEDILGGYVILRSEGSPISSPPADGQTYARGMTVGNAKVVYSGRPDAATFEVNARYVLAGKTYYFAAYPYSGAGSFTNYREQATPIMVESPSTMVSASEYTTVNTASPTFITDLKAVINPHNSIFYSNYAPVMVNLWQARDTFAVVGANTFTRVINCAYSGETKLFNNPFDWTGTGYSREHTFPHSWMPSFPADNPEQPEYNDYHNLYPARQTNVNDIRCNYPFGEVVTVEVNFLEGTLGLDASGRRVYEPRDEHKGRAARALMYMATCYNGPAATFNFNNPVGKQCLNTPITYPQDQNVIKKWHFQYPPNGFDISRNDFLDSVQTNRNPFVDQPDYACYIDFLTMSKVENPGTPCYDTTTSVNTISNMHLLAYPNPTNGSFRISWMGNGEAMDLQILDMTGRVVMRRREISNNGVNIVDLNADTLPKGIYRIQLNGVKNSAGIPLVVN